VNTDLEVTLKMYLNWLMSCWKNILKKQSYLLIKLLEKKKSHQMFKLWFFWIQLTTLMYLLTYL
jgi:hypothetical protein